MTTQRSRKTLAHKQLELAFAVPAVVAHRVTRMAQAGAKPSRADHREFHRMWSEKVLASGESWNAMMLAAFQANLTFMMSWWTFPFWTTSQTQNRFLAHGRHLSHTMLASGLGPVHRRVVANARRLGRTKR